jgi:hypothetical protein
MLLLGPFTFFTHSSLLSLSLHIAICDCDCEGAHLHLYCDCDLWRDPKQGQGVELALWDWDPFKPCSVPQNIQVLCQFSAKSYRRAFLILLVLVMVLVLVPGAMSFVGQFISISTFNIFEIQTRTRPKTKTQDPTQPQPSPAHCFSFLIHMKRFAACPVSINILAT